MNRHRHNHRRQDHDADYNYARFRATTYDLATFAGPRVGEIIPNASLTTLDGQPHRLHDFAGRTLVIETGSVTCPMYAKNVNPMADLARRHPEVDFIVLYVREAHPGGRLGPHQSDHDKTTAAALLADRYGESRLVLIDDLEGSTHHQLGLLPNVVYVVGPDGVVRFRGDWNDPAAIDAVLDGTAPESLVAREHFPPAKPGPTAARKALLAGGGQAVIDFVVSLPSLLAAHHRADHAHHTTHHTTHHTARNTGRATSSPPAG